MIDGGLLVGVAAALVMVVLSRPVVELLPFLGLAAVSILYLAWPCTARRWTPSRGLLRNRKFGSSVALGALLVAVICMFITYIFPFDTEYAPGYSEAAFRSVQIGDSREDVIALLGEPLFVHTVGVEGTETWGEWLRYSWSPSSKNYLVRQFMLDGEGQVVKILSEVWWD